MERDVRGRATGAGASSAGRIGQLSCFALADDAITVLANPMIRSIIQSLVAQARRSPDLAAAFTERFQTPRRQA